jgi:hypothetical protein
MNTEVPERQTLKIWASVTPAALHAPGIDALPTQRLYRQTTDRGQLTVQVVYFG